MSCFNTFSVASRRNLGKHFQLGVWSTFLNTSKMLLIYIIWHTFRQFFYCCIRCFFEQNIRKLFVYIRNLSENNKFSFSFVHLWGYFFGAHSVWTLSALVWNLDATLTLYPKHSIPCFSQSKINVLLPGTSLFLEKRILQYI